MFQTLSDSLAPILAALPASLTVPLPLAVAAGGALCLIAFVGARRRAALRQAAADAQARALRAEDRLAAQAAALDRAQTTEDELRDALEARAADLAQLRVDAARERATASGALRAAEDRLAQMQSLREQMTVQFRDLAQQALQTQGESLSRAHVDRLNATLSPLKEHVGHFETALKAMHESSQKERIELRKELDQLTRQTARITEDAHALTRALKSDQQKQGAWGEMVLERILESSGLREGEEYVTQAHRESDAGDRLRPDVVVTLPGGKTLVIDSKVSLTAYTDLVNAEDDAAAARAGALHRASLRAHVDRLARKDYAAAEANSVDYVILFVPIEGAFSEALRLDGTLATHALERNVTIATPTTLMMALRTVAHVWAVERRNRNAEEIALRAGRLYDKVAGFVGSLDEVGSRLDQAQGSYTRAVDQLTRGRGNVLAQVDQLRALGARATKAMPMDHDTDPDSDTGTTPARLPSAAE